MGGEFFGWVWEGEGNAGMAEGVAGDGKTGLEKYCGKDLRS